MSDNPNEQKIADLEQANADLKGSLAKCRELLSECRTKLAANSNLAEPMPDADEDSDRKRG